MSIPGKVLIAVLVAFAVAGIAAALDPGYTLAAAFPIAAAAAVLSVVLSHRALRLPTTRSAGAPRRDRPAESGAQAGKRQAGRQDAGGEGRAGGKAAKKAPARRAAPGRPREIGQARTSGLENIEQGQVKWFDGTKGFGFIIRANGEEIFVHHRSLVGRGRRSLKDGAAVRYRVVNTEKGPQAEDVEPA